MSASTNKHKLIAAATPSSRHAEAYRTLRANIQFASRDREMRVILVTSAGEGEGKTMTAGNLAVLYAQMGKRTLLVDANLRKPELHRYFNVSARQGITDLLSEESDWEQAVQTDAYPGLSLLAAGSPTAFPSEMLASERFARLLERLRTRFDMIIVDSASVLGSSDTQFIAALSDGIVLVVRPGRVTRAEGRQAIAKLELADADVIGVVLNR
ncbi:CpsD/CapB family tyrosine-protein kinase [Cohnella nanjingensis]|uniref:non-specific protein-tyrosine kinase n=1 Tax=Cohnella nanjingensis TaxID=1387779 RepID=A0A7X0RQ73_9BACL|nr:CpsD/CapB family tyrosine-protein kinase [Cohnella nanjingensis]MBB6671697.1 CpsD/CapB family tyrosine-protein kinase [Cohnella nanjingensis]